MTKRTTSPDQIDDAVAVLAARKQEWAGLDLPRRLSLLVDLRRRVAAVADAWVAAGAAAKGIAPDAPVAAEEWLSGPYVTLTTIAALHASLARLWRGQPTYDPDRVAPGPGDRVRVTTVPTGLTEKLFASGYTGEVWIGPENRATPLDMQTAKFYRDPAPVGRLCVVLGAGNISSIPALDTLGKLFVEGQVVALKMSPVLDYLGSIFEHMFEPLTGPGYVRIVYGGGDVGSALIAHDGTDTVHITGSAATYDTIVFGGGEEGERRRAADEPLMTKPISSELGGVSPVIVVPGPWSDADVAYQAELITAAKVNNAGFNCVAAQVAIVPDRWQYTDLLLTRVEQSIAGLPVRPAYYPGAAGRCDGAVAGHGNVAFLGGDPPRAHVRGIAPDSGHALLREEVFGPVLASTRLDHGDPGDFLAAAVHFANHELAGTLGANVIVHPETASKLGDRFTTAVTDLRYGCVAVNTWTGFAYGQPRLPWMAYPGNHRSAIGSGDGIVHNALMFDHPEKAVVTGPFFPAHRSWRSGGVNLAPRPPWFPTNTTALTTARRLTRHAADGSARHVPGIVLSALTG